MNDAANVAAPPISNDYAMDLLTVLRGEIKAQHHAIQDITPSPAGARLAYVPPLPPTAWMQSHGRREPASA